MKDNSPISTWHLHITGQVQGVGFRPTVYRIAQHFSLAGQVKNTTDGLHIIFNGNKTLAEKVKEEICKNSLPSLAIITRMQFKELSKQEFDSFQIIHESDHSTPNLILTPDVALCEPCSQELNDERDRRNTYAFNSCSQCGPRYSIVTDLPYDRVNTKMDSFDLCASCEAEYNTPSNRRYFAQTISCPNCAIGLKLYRSGAEMLSADNKDILDKIPILWKDGKIIAIKGIGGFLLTCDASNEDAIKRLRTLKHRPTKPLAVMYPDLKSLEVYDISQEAEEMLTSHISPIVLIPKVDNSIIAKGVCDDQDSIGVMLPYAPIFKVLLSKFKRSIIATSGNLSNAPIAYTDEDAFEQLSDIADYILTNERDIVVPQDDSVVKFSEVHNQKIILRRSRGLAPSYIHSELKLDSESLLATGAQLKSTFAISQYPNTYISQYLGDLESFDTIINYKHCLTHLTELLKIKPTRILSDRHQGYASTNYGFELATNWNIPVDLVPHHKAHFSAILGEHNLIDTDEPVLGVIWDGAGLGDDDNILGSEFFTYQDLQFNRCTHLTNFDLLLGDKMAKEPRLSALSLAHELPQAHDILLQKFSNTEWKVYTKKLNNDDHIQTSSMGRLFDAVASLIGLNDKQSFEGEAAMALEVLARGYYRKHGIVALQQHYFNEDQSDATLSAQKLMEALLVDLNKGIESSHIAAKFHLTLIRWISKIATKQGCKKIAFSGGVFQNGLLVDLAIEHLSQDHELYFHEQLSPNDENISFGQLIYHKIAKKRIGNA